MWAVERFVILGFLIILDDDLLDDRPERFGLRLETLREMQERLRLTRTPEDDRVKRPELRVRRTDERMLLLDESTVCEGTGSGGEDTFSGRRIIEVDLVGSTSPIIVAE